VNIRFCSAIDRSSGVFSLVNNPPEIAEPVPRNHCANIGIGLESFDRRGKNRSGSKFLGASYDRIVKLVILGLVDDKLLNTNAVLASILAG